MVKLTTDVVGETDEYRRARVVAFRRKAGCFREDQNRDNPKHDRATNRIAATGPFRRTKGGWKMADVYARNIS